MIGFSYFKGGAMALQLGDLAPDFTTMTTEGEIHFYEWLDDKWCIFFSHPRDFTPVCTTELGAVAKLKSELEKRNCKVIALSVDAIDDHKKWIEDINATQGTTVNFPIVADFDKKIANAYGMIHPNASDSFTVRSVFVIGPDKKVKLTLTYPASTGRNFQEILRVIDSLQLTSQHSVATPADWKQGEDVVIVPSVSNEEATKRFPKGFKEIRPYLRMTPHPDKH
jgi:alkyl hydroperoxide reductase subunit AhpC